MNMDSEQLVAILDRARDRGVTTYAKAKEMLDKGGLGSDPQAIALLSDWAQKNGIKGAPRATVARKGINRRSPFTVFGCFGLCVLALAFPPIGTQSSTYGHIRMSGFGMLWDLGGKVINIQLLALEIGVICFFAYLLSRKN